MIVLYTARAWGVFHVHGVLYYLCCHKRTLSKQHWRDGYHTQQQNPIHFWKKKSIVIILLNYSSCADTSLLFKIAWLAWLSQLSNG